MHDEDQARNRRDAGWRFPKGRQCVRVSEELQEYYRLCPSASVSVGKKEGNSAQIIGVSGLLKEKIL